MLLSGFTFIRNAVKYDFPIRECIASMLPIVDELVINVGRSDDGTEEFVERIVQDLSRELGGSNPDRIRLIHSVWDDSKTDRGLVLSEQTNIALDACRGRWALYLQADEALHEGEIAAIRAAVEAADREPHETQPEGLRLRYLHFYGGYSLVQRTWNWYPSEIRVVRRSSGARSFGDAQTFRVPPDNRELKTRLLETHAFHYGHARAPETMKKKISYFHRFWHGDDHKIAVDQAYAIDLKNLVWYWGTHPAAYAERVARAHDWSPRPEQVANPQRFLSVVILDDAATKRLSDELARLLKQARPDLRVIVNPATVADASQCALVDLLAESRGQLAALMMGAWMLRGGRFAWSVAHAPEGTLSATRARRYDAVNWGRHQTSKQGFRVPEPEQARQLGRWLGVDWSAMGRMR